MCKTKLILFVGLLCFGLNATAFGADNLASVAVTPREVSLSYPCFDNIGAAGMRITSTIAAEIDSFAKKFRLPEYSGKVDYVVEFNKVPVISVTVQEMYYQYHAAHPMSYLRAFTFDTKTGEALRLTDLFRQDADYRGRLNEILTAQIVARDIHLLKDKEFAGVKDDQEFYLAPDALVVYYQRYEYTAYAQGFFKFFIPYSDIAGLLKPELLQALTPAAN